MIMPLDTITSVTKMSLLPFWLSFWYTGILDIYNEFSYWFLQMIIETIYIINRKKAMCQINKSIDFEVIQTFTGKTRAGFQVVFE